MASLKTKTCLLRGKHRKKSVKLRLLDGVRLFLIALGEHSATTDHGELMTLVADKQQRLLMAGDDDEVYDKKPQRYAEDNTAACK